jgi:hypothetical protein
MTNYILERPVYQQTCLSELVDSIVEASRSFTSELHQME